MLEALATVSSRGVCVWMYRWQVDRRTTSNKNMKQVIDNLMMNVKANKRVVDRCLMAKMGLMESPITSPTVMLSKQLRDCKGVLTERLNETASVLELRNVESSKVG